MQISYPSNDRSRVAVVDKSTIRVRFPNEDGPPNYVRITVVGEA